jgi:flagellar basal body rod protein FlgC
MDEFDILRTSAAGMDAERAALEVAARNVAASETVGDGRFARLVPHFVTSGGEDGSAPTVRFAGAVPQPGVEVDAVTEMVSVLDAQRAFEANASVFDVGKHLAEATIELGRL